MSDMSDLSTQANPGSAHWASERRIEVIVRVVARGKLGPDASGLGGLASGALCATRVVGTSPRTEGLTK